MGVSVKTRHVVSALDIGTHRYAGTYEYHDRQRTGRPGRNFSYHDWHIQVRRLPPSFPVPITVKEDFYRMQVRLICRPPDMLGTGPIGSPLV
jgi:hypothetical protein